MPPEQTNSETTGTETKAATTETTEQTAKTEGSLTDGTSSLLTKTGEAATTEEAKSTEQATEVAKPGVPEKYEFKPIEGFTLEGPVLEKATALFKELGLPQEQADKLVSFHAEQLKEAAQGPYKLWQDTQETWLDELRSDPKIGKAVDSGEVGASVSKMISSLPVEQGTAFREALNYTGSGNNPAIVRGLYELSKRFAEPGHVQGAGPAAAKTGRPTPAAALYPNLAPKET